MVRLVLLRHAHAVSGSGEADVDRPLAEHGLGEAERIGGWIAAHGIPQAALVSTALRARQTADAASHAWPGVRTEYLEALYGADAKQIMALLRERDETIVVVVGHNPTMAELVQALTGSMESIRPGMAAVIDLPDWHASQGRLVALGQP